MLPGKGAQMAFDCTSAILLAREGTYAQVRLRSMKSAACMSVPRDNR